MVYMNTFAGMFLTRLKKCRLLLANGREVGENQQLEAEF